MPWRSEDHQPFDLAVGNSLEDVYEDLDMFVELIFWIGLFDELSQAESFTLRRLLRYWPARWLREDEALCLLEPREALQLRRRIGFRAIFEF